MQIRTAKAAILAQSRRPLVVDEIALPEALGVGQVLVKVLYTTICGAQINEIDALKGPDKFLPHLLGHEASARVVETGPGVTTVRPGDTVVQNGTRHRWGNRGTEPAVLAVFLIGAHRAGHSDTRRGPSPTGRRR